MLGVMWTTVSQNSGANLIYPECIQDQVLQSDAAVSPTSNLTWEGQVSFWRLGLPVCRMELIVIILTHGEAVGLK